tara:strand:- start:78 stop:794 length:717 start_codon:yes stop_codon:yes gene_type:complete
MELLIDNREKIKNLFPTDNIKFENLELGDYIIKYKDEILLIIERKTISDLMSSIKDGRLREQKKRLISNYSLSKILYIIEGDINTTKFVNPDTIISSIVNTTLRDKINVLLTKNSAETVKIITSISEKINKQGTSFLQSTSHYDDNIVHNLQTSKKSNITVDVCQKMMLCSIPTVSSKISERLLLNFGNIFNLITSIRQIDDSEQISYIQNLPSFDEKTRKIGKNVAENILKYLVHSD